MYKMEKRLLIAAAALFAVVAVLARAAPAKPPNRKPNVVFIMTDDQQRGTFGFLDEGRGKVLTPHIDSLARDGVYFSEAHVSSSVCTPSRYTMLTGQYASRCLSRKFVGNSSRSGQTCVLWNANIEPGDWNIAKVLNEDGYATGIVGKCHGLTGAKYAKVPLGADPNGPKIARVLKENQAKQSEAMKRLGFDYAASLYHGNIPGHSCKALYQHNMEWVTQGALDFIEQNKAGPFFLYMSTTLLHGPSPRESFRADPRITEAGLLDKPPGSQPSRESVLKRVREAGLSEAVAPCTWLDDGLGAVLKKLDELGIAENTVVMYFNDHGMEKSKSSLYRAGVRTPFLIRWKGHIKGGKPCDKLVQNIDIVPTILDLCGIEPPGEMHLDGRSLVPLLQRKDPEWRDSLYFEIGYTRGVTDGRWKYIAFRPPEEALGESRASRLAKLERYRNRKSGIGTPERGRKIDPDAPITHLGMIVGGTNTEEGPIKKYKHYFDRDQLYDLKKDPGEQNNLAGNPKYAEKLAEMKKLLKSYLDDLPGAFGELKK